MTQFCGLCNMEIGDWRKHVESEEHKKNLSDPDAIAKAIRSSTPQNCIGE